MLQVHFQLEDGRQTDHHLQVLLSPHIYVSQYCLPLSESHTALGHWAEEKSRPVTMSALWWRPSVLTCCGERDTAHTTVWAPAYPLQAGMLGRRGRGRRGGEPGFQRLLPHSTLHTHAVSFVRVSQPHIVHGPGGCEKHCTRRSNHALPATVRQQQASSTAQVPREWQDVLRTSLEVSLASWSLLYYLYYFNSFLLGSPASPCKTSSEMPLWELIMLPWQPEFSKFISPPLLPSVNSLSHLSLHMFCTGNKTGKKIRPIFCKFSHTHSI